MFEFKPLTPRVQRIRKAYRETVREIDTSRYRIITDYYMSHPECIGIMRRARSFAAICEGVVVRIDPEEVIVGSQGAKFASASMIHHLIT